MKYNLYKQNFTDFEIDWNEARSWHYNATDEIEVEMMRFICELNLSDQLRTFYWTEISESVRCQHEFLDLVSIFKRNASNKGPKFYTSRLKE